MMGVSSFGMDIYTSGEPSFPTVTGTHRNKQSACELRSASEVRACIDLHVSLLRNGAASGPRRLDQLIGPTNLWKVTHQLCTAQLIRERPNHIPIGTVGSWKRFVAPHRPHPLRLLSLLYKSCLDFPISEWASISESPTTVVRRSWWNDWTMCVPTLPSPACRKKLRRFSIHSTPPVPNFRNASVN